MPYEAEARIICRISANEKDAVIRPRNAPMESLPGFQPMGISQRLFAVPPAPVGSVPDNDREACFTKAADYVKAELPAAYAIDEAGGNAVFGHAFIEGRWVPIPSTQASYAFPLVRNGERIEDETLSKDGAGKAHPLALSWWVVVQPK